MVLVSRQWFDFNLWIVLPLLYPPSKIRRDIPAPAMLPLGLSIAFLGDQWCCGAALQFGALTNHHSRRFVRTASITRGLPDQHHRHCLLKVLTLKRCGHRLLLHISQKKDTFLLPPKWPFWRSINDPWWSTCFFLWRYHEVMECCMVSVPSSKFPMLEVAGSGWHWMQIVWWSWITRPWIALPWIA